MTPFDVECPTVSVSHSPPITPLSVRHSEGVSQLDCLTTVQDSHRGCEGSAAPLSRHRARTHSADVAPGRVLAPKTTTAKGPKASRVLEAIRGQCAQSIPQCVYGPCLQSAGRSMRPGMTIHVWPFVGQCSGVGASHETIGVFGCDFSTSDHSRECVAESLQSAGIASGLLRRGSQVRAPRILTAAARWLGNGARPSPVPGGVWVAHCSHAMARRIRRLATGEAGFLSPARRPCPPPTLPAPAGLGVSTGSFHTRSAWL
jgi:hypothetical protein